jgi:hypothetical protein
MKKTEIDFDFAKWGQEGISVELNSSEVIKIHEYIDSAVLYGVNLKGAFLDKKENFKMFEEVKPREFWVNVSQDEIKIYESAKEAAFFLRENSQTIKVREVIE